jgi:hypothetical protein
MQAECDIIDALMRLERKYLTGIQHIDGLAYMPVGTGKTFKANRITRTAKVTPAGKEKNKRKRKIAKASRRRNRR